MTVTATPRVISGISDTGRVATENEFDGDGDFAFLQPGRITGLIGAPGFGLTRLALSLLASARVSGPITCLDVRGWLSPQAAWESGIGVDQLVVARCEDPVRWARTVATLVAGVGALYAEVPKGVKVVQLRKLGALVRTQKTPVVLRPLAGDLPSGVAHLTLVAREVVWDGTDRGHGRLTKRRLVCEASGKAMRGMSRLIELEDHGADALHLVSGLAATSSRRAVG